MRSRRCLKLARTVHHRSLCCCFIKSPSVVAAQLRGECVGERRILRPSWTAPGAPPGVSQAWFTSLYNVLFGEARGPRFGSFVALYGVAETRSLIEAALSGALVAEHEAFVAGTAKVA